VNPNDITGTEFLQAACKEMQDSGSSVVRFQITFPDDSTGYLYLSSFDPTEGGDWDE